MLSKRKIPLHGKFWFGISLLAKAWKNLSIKPVKPACQAFAKNLRVLPTLRFLG
jgi:hypothetical protein